MAGVAFHAGVAVIAVMLIAACASGTLASKSTPSQPGATSNGNILVSLNPEVTYPESYDPESGLKFILGTPDLGVGRQRVSFIITHSRGLFRFPVVQVESYYLPEGSPGLREGPVQTTQAQFQEFSLGTRGIYVTHLEFDRAGTWQLEASFPDPDGGRVSTTLSFDVSEDTQAPGVGDRAPRTDNRTSRDVSIEELTTSYKLDPALYRTSIADALSASRPVVVTFASPAFCTTAFCGPQVDVLSDLRKRYDDRAEFIHIDLYENPHEIQGDLSRAVRNSVLAEWGISTDEWTFIVDREGRIAGRYESFVAEQELEEDLLAVLDEDKT